MLSNNIVTISAAGSGKTTTIVDEAMVKTDSKVLIVTYTNENLNEIKRKIIKKYGFIPSHIKIQGWYSFLLQECARPYQNFIYDKKRIESILLVEGRSPAYIKKADVEKYYFAKGTLIYTDKISQFIYECNKKSNGLVINRLEKMYDHIYIDEVQDLNGWDLDLIQMFFKSSIKMSLVGDHRQTTYKTNNAARNGKYSGVKILDFFLDLEKRKKCSVKYRTECHRSNQLICDFADTLYPIMKKTISKNHEETGHDGLFTVNESEVTDYINTYNPVVLRYDKRSKFDAEKIMNYGMSKGLTFDRVLIIPTAPIKKYLMKKGELEGESLSKFYVAVTRAKYSVAFLMKESVTFEGIRAYQVANS
ncbi:UvrD-helicase domain-containing protein [Paenibacillus pectinilyticus]|nr:UvrD-helicase domain-containing protein [Paenibacillus pectinilyticus]